MWVCSWVCVRVGGCFWRSANGLVNVLVSGYSARQLLNKCPGSDGCLGGLDFILVGVRIHALVGGLFKYFVRWVSEREKNKRRVFVVF